MKLAGVAGLVLRAHAQDRQPAVLQRGTQPDPVPELLGCVGAPLGVGRHGGGVALLRRLRPQHLADALREAVPAGEGDGLPAYGRPVPLQVHFTCKNKFCSIPGAPLSCFTGYQGYYDYFIIVD